MSLSENPNFPMTELHLRGPHFPIYVRLEVQLDPAVRYVFEKQPGEEYVGRYFRPAPVDRISLIPSQGAQEAMTAEHRRNRRAALRRVVEELVEHMLEHMNSQDPDAAGYYPHERSQQR